MRKIQDVHLELIGLCNTYSAQTSCVEQINSPVFSIRSSSESGNLCALSEGTSEAKWGFVPSLAPNDRACLAWMLAHGSHNGFVMACRWNRSGREWEREYRRSQMLPLQVSTNGLRSMRRPNHQIADALIPGYYDSALKIHSSGRSIGRCHETLSW